MAEELEILNAMEKNSASNEHSKCYHVNFQCVADTAWSVPCCAAVSASILAVGLLSALVALGLLREPGNDGTESGSEDGWSVYVRRSGHTVEV